ncbi:transposase [Cupriavidus necator]|uniref:Cas12f1-like TNB domain-containing protein n=1 Tax=Cupriavidus necator TaxID=106590 RepID=A0A367PG18_CUPNE|nr:transposase [Cupriavidus necator]RCJ06799.1 hypothetical protein DDK22_19285 [Cupriavidus necator]
MWFKEVDEAYFTQDCHVCGSRSCPKWLVGLSVRRWRCSHCFAEHEPRHQRRLQHSQARLGLARRIPHCCVPPIGVTQQ